MSTFMSTWGVVVWTAWLAFFATSFTVFEAWALMTKGLSLSQYTWHLSEEWPPIIFIDGFLIGLLVAHFWWHWNPPSIGQLGGTGG